MYVGGRVWIWSDISYTHKNTCKHTHTHTHTHARDKVQFLSILALKYEINLALMYEIIYFQIFCCIWIHFDDFIEKICFFFV